MNRCYRIIASCGVTSNLKATRCNRTAAGGVGELRNGYGTGHGKDADFKGLEIKYAKLLVGIVSEVAIFYLATNGETAELIDTI